MATESPTMSPKPNENLLNSGDAKAIEIEQFSDQFLRDLGFALKGRRVYATENNSLILRATITCEGLTGSFICWSSDDKFLNRIEFD